jgi:hypothetical protein
MCNARSNLISGKYFDLEKGFASNLWKNMKTHLIYKTPEVAREREIKPI